MQLRLLRKQQKKVLLCDTRKKYQILIKFSISSYTWGGLSERKIEEEEIVYKWNCIDSEKKV